MGGGLAFADGIPDQVRGNVKMLSIRVCAQVRRSGFQSTGDGNRSRFS
jgi:hypothetical protein